MQVREASQFADGDGAEAQVRREIRRAFDSGEVTRVLVVRDALLEVRELGFCPGRSRGDFEAGEVAGAEAEIGQRRH